MKQPHEDTLYCDNRSAGWNAFTVVLQLAGLIAIFAWIAVLCDPNIHLVVRK